MRHESILGTNNRRSSNSSPIQYQPSRKETSFKSGYRCGTSTDNNHTNNKNTNNHNYTTIKKDNTFIPKNYVQKLEQEETLDDNQFNIICKKFFRSLADTFGDDPDRSNIIDTPLRLISFFKEALSGYKQNPKNIFTTTYDNCENSDQMVILKNCRFNSIDERYLSPFSGVAIIAFIPDKKMIGLHEISKLLEVYSKRLQTQENIGNKITDDIMYHLNAKGAACILTADHFYNGNAIQDLEFTTTSFKGTFEDSITRQELFQKIYK